MSTAKATGNHKSAKLESSAIDSKPGEIRQSRTLTKQEAIDRNIARKKHRQHLNQRLFEWRGNWLIHEGETIDLGGNWDYKKSTRLADLDLSWIEELEKEVTRPKEVSYLLDRAPVHRGEQSCNRWTGWVAYQTNFRKGSENEVIKAISCNTYKCKECGTRKKGQIVKKLAASWARTWPGQRPIMATFTMRNKYTWEDWDHYFKFHGVTPLPLTERPTWEEATPAQIVNWVNEEQPLCRPWRRAQLTAREWQLYFSGLLLKLTRTWSRTLDHDGQDDDRLPYFATRQFHKSGHPHWHFVFPSQVLLSFGGSRSRFVDWLRTTWHDMVPDSTWERGCRVTFWDQYHFKTGKKYASVQQALWYITNYVLEDLGKDRFGWTAQHYRRSHHWQFPVKGPLAKFLAVDEDGETYVRDLHQHLRTVAACNRYVNANRTLPWKWGLLHEADLMERADQPWWQPEFLTRKLAPAETITQQNAYDNRRLYLQWPDKPFELEYIVIEDQRNPRPGLIWHDNDRTLT